MKRETLKGLGISRENIDIIMHEHGQTIERLKRKMDNSEESENKADVLTSVTQMRSLAYDMLLDTKKMRTRLAIAFIASNAVWAAVVVYVLLGA